KSAAITDAALALHASLRSLGSVSMQQRLQNAQRLNEVIFAPVQSQVSGKRALTVVADGALHYVPFGVLHDKQAGKFVIQDHDLALAPSARTLFQRSAGQKQPTAPRMLLVADPLY